MSEGNDSNLDIRVRVAPSPTGRFHIGNMRTAFYVNFMGSKPNGASILRIEDTDQTRKIESGNELLKETFDLFNIEFDEGPEIGGDYGPYIQSERLDLYKKYAHELVDNGHAYYCFCSSERLEELRNSQKADGKPTMYDRKCRNLDISESRARVEAGESYVIRMKMPTEGITEFRDLIMGRVKFQNELVEDSVILKSDGFPTYHLAVVVDDHLMKITHVFRGTEWLPSAPKHQVLYNSFGWEMPNFAHLPLILNADGKGKLSKRKGALPATSYLRKGYMPEAVMNYFSLIGWSPAQADAHQDEVYTIDEMIQLFDISRIQKSGGRFNQNKFDAISGKHIRRLTIDQLVEKVFEWADRYVLAELISDKIEEIPEWEQALKISVGESLPKWKNDIEYFKLCLAQVQERLTYFGELPELLDFYYSDELNFVDEEWKFKDRTRSEFADALEGILPKLDSLFSTGEFDHEKWEATVRGYADELGWGHGDLFMAIRSATTGKLKSPPLLESYEILGWEKVRGFMNSAIAWLRA